MSQQEHRRYVAEGTTPPAKYHLDSDCGLSHEADLIPLEDAEINAVRACTNCTDRPGANKLREQLHGDEDEHQNR